MSYNTEKLLIAEFEKVLQNHVDTGIMQEKMKEIFINSSIETFNTHKMETNKEVQFVLI